MNDWEVPNLRRNDYCTVEKRKREDSILASNIGGGGVFLSDSKCWTFLKWWSTIYFSFD